jgi:uncharacterized protein YycO
MQGDAAVNPVRAALQNGDWLVARGVHLADNLVATVTDKPLSHAAVYDAESDVVIEVDGSGVHTTPLAGFVANSTRVLVIQPMWATPENRAQAVARARQWLGRGYNFTGLIGLSMPERYYCSQLVVQAYEPFIDHGPRQNPIPHIIEPGQLYHWGRIVYDSGP